MLPDLPTFSYREAARLLGVDRKILAGAAKAKGVPTDRALCRADVLRLAEALGVEVDETEAA
jgi:hypothetical protein